MHNFLRCTGFTVSVMVDYSVVNERQIKSNQHFFYYYTFVSDSFQH